MTDTITFDGYTETVLHGGTTTTTKYYSAIGQRVGMKTGNTLYYLVNDSLGGASLVLKSDASVQAVQLFAPYGATRYSQGTMPTTYNFTGQRLDSETGLLYYNFRYYDPLSGRFARADTVQNNAGGKDLYAYVGNNPETKNDPTGHKDCAGCYQYWHKSNGPLPPVDYLVLAAPLGFLLLFGIGGVALLGIAAPGAALVTALAPAGVGAASGVVSTALYGWITGKPQSLGDYVESAVVNALASEFVGLPAGLLLLLKPTPVASFLAPFLIGVFSTGSTLGLIQGIVERICDELNHSKQQDTPTKSPLVQQIPVPQRDTWWNDPGWDSNALSTNYPSPPLRGVWRNYY